MNLKIKKKSNKKINQKPEKDILEILNILRLPRSKSESKQSLTEILYEIRHGEKKLELQTQNFYCACSCA